MHQYVLIQEINASHEDSDGGVANRLGSEAERIEWYQVGKYRITLVQMAGTWGPEAKLQDWADVNGTNLIAWERVS